MASSPEEFAKKEVKEEDQNAYNANLKAHRPGISLEETIRCYDEMANRGTYEHDLCPVRYRGPQIASDTVNEWVKNKQSRILDVAAGTGFVAEQLKSRGFTNVDALEPSREMLHVAKEKRLYREHICAAITTEKTNIPDDAYDTIVISGGMGEGHIPTIGMKELLRVTKPGGLVVIVMRKEYLKYVNDYAGRLEPFMNKLEQMSLWKCEEKKEVKGYSFTKKCGLVFVFRVNTKGCPNYESLNID